MNKAIKMWLKTARLNWKPLFGGLVAAAPSIINAIMPLLDPQTQGIITALGILWMAIFVKQKNVTGGDVRQVMK